MCKKTLGIHVKTENLKSDKRLSWMCLEGDVGLFVGVHFDGAYSDEQPLENIGANSLHEIFVFGTCNNFVSFVSIAQTVAPETRCAQEPTIRRDTRKKCRQAVKHGYRRKCSQFTSTRNACSPSHQKVSSHSHGTRKNRVKIEGLIVSTTADTEVKQKSSREPDSHKKGCCHTPSEKMPLLYNTR